jgi:hypothetical protein
MNKYRSLFKKFGGEYIPDIVEYLREQINADPNITISVGKEYLNFLNLYT